MNMNNDPFSKLKAIHKDRGEPKREKFITPEGYTGYKCYHPEMGYYEIHICKTREDVAASKSGGWQ
jgi:hypothetical protein